jgi:hypothetical protein
VQIIKNNGLVVSPTKINLFQNNMCFFGHNIFQNTITPINRSIQFEDKFSDEIKDKNQLQIFLGSLNYIFDYYENLRIICKPLYQRLQKTRPPWSTHHTEIVRQIRKHVKVLPCLGLPSSDTFKIVEIDTSENGYGGIPKQKISNSKEQLVRYHSGV